jgi:hypothetical protein
MHLVRLWLAAALLFFGACGCSSAVSSGHNTALGGADLIQMTDDMANQIVASPAVRAAIASQGPLKIVCEPVENNMTAEILTTGQSEGFTGRLRSLLSKHAPNDFIWIMNRDAFNDLRQQELNYDLGPSPDAMNPEYALYAKFYTLTNETASVRSDYYLCVFQLTSLIDRSVLWSGKYEVKKVAVKGFLD